MRRGSQPGTPGAARGGEGTGGGGGAFSPPLAVLGQDSRGALDPRSARRASAASGSPRQVCTPGSPLSAQRCPSPAPLGETFIELVGNQSPEPRFGGAHGPRHPVSQP